MTDWLSQTRAGVDQWLETQQQWWAAVLGPAAADPKTGAMDDLRERTIEAWRQAAYKVIDAQAQMLLGAMRERPANDAEALVRQWTDAQREMWQGWLAVAGRGASGGAAPPDLAAAGQEMVASLRDAAEKLVASQAEWAKAWNAAAEPPPEKTKKKKKKKD